MRRKFGACRASHKVDFQKNLLGNAMKPENQSKSKIWNWTARPAFHAFFEVAVLSSSPQYLLITCRR